MVPDLSIGKGKGRGDFCLAVATPVLLMVLLCTGGSRGDTMMVEPTPTGGMVGDGEVSGGKERTIINVVLP